MNREITVVLKQPAQESKSPGRRVLDFANELVKSPLFVFLFGASLATIYPAIKQVLTPDREVELQRAQEDARADAILIAPFIANLNANEPGKFEASKAALQALERASRAVAKDGERPMFTAVNRAIEAVAVQIRPPTDKSALTKAVVQQIDTSAKVVEPVSDTAAISFNQLKDALVYIQVDRNNAAQQQVAEKVMQTLRANSVITPGIEKLAAGAIPNKTQVRYFHAADQVRAETLAAIVGLETKLKVYTAKPNLDAKPGTLELWFGTQ